MRRKQLYLDDELDDELERLAERTGRSQASHVRDALWAYLRQAGAITDREARLRAADALCAIDAPMADWDVVEREIEAARARS